MKRLIGRANYCGAGCLPVLSGGKPSSDALVTDTENEAAFHRVRIAAFTTTERALIRLAYASGSARGLYDGPLIASALTCYALRFVELTAALVPVYAPHLCGIY